MAQGARKLKHSTMKMTRTTSRTSSEKSRRSSSITPVATAFLTPLLPKGWQAYFDIKQAGKNWGIAIKCPSCGQVPPTTFFNKKLQTNQMLSHYRRLRWMMVHIAQHKPVSLSR